MSHFLALDDQHTMSSYDYIKIEVKQANRKSFSTVFMIDNIYLFNRHFKGHHQSTAGHVIW